MSVFYERFTRHAAGQGVKGHSTHYCPGCGHGLVHKFLADAIADLRIQDRTVAISPVGCAVFLYYYLDIGHVQAAHGRAPAVALAQKLAHPESIVVTYQGDGDLASIGLAEILQAAQLGVPISVIFVNNAVYGMTGGQMAPTTLMGQKTATSPFGRGPLMGQPLRVAELIAGLDGPVYVERVALYDSKQEIKAHKAVRRALQLQVENRGFSFVEVLAECPLHLGLTPQEAQTWVRDHMVPVFPLGVKKDATATKPAWPAWPPPRFEPETVYRLIGGTTDRAARYAPAPAGGALDDVGIKLAGAGGDGAQTAALMLARTAINEGCDATHIPSYGPESRGGTSYADVRIARDEVLSPAVPSPHILVAFNAPSLARFGPAVLDGGTIVYDSSVTTDVPTLGAGVRAFAVPAAAIANGLGRLTVKNVVALGALAAVTSLFPKESYLAAIRQALAGKPDLLAMNEQAFAAGAGAATAVV